MVKSTFTIDGNNFSNLSEFFEEFSRVLTPEVWWGRNLDAFNDVLRGGFGTPAEGYVLVWKNSDVSRDRLGYSQTVRELERMLSRAHPTARSSIQKRIELARQQEGETVFDWLVNAIRRENAKIQLVLERTH
jgi:RNAse (barnase) inhibitor barstar